MPSNKQKGINPNCPCPKISCRRHGDCKACKQHHRSDSAFCETESVNLEKMNLDLFHTHFHQRHGKAMAYKLLKQLIN